MFPDRLKALRTGSRLTLKQLAHQLNQQNRGQHNPNTSAQIDNWERGIRKPSYLEVLKIARYFRVSMDYLTGRSGDDSCDLAKLLVTNRQLRFNHHPLDNRDRNEIYALIQGYLKGRNRRSIPTTSRENQQQSLNLEKRNQN